MVLPIAQDESRFPQHVGIIGMDVYFPRTYVDQTDLEQFDNVSSGKYTIGLGQQKMAFCNDREDIQSICMTVVQSVMKKYQVSCADIGRLEVGTETIIDKSKSVKTCLMQFFQENGNTDIEGIDTTNACYGGTAALLNAIHWIESSAWDGRLALVIAGDIAVYASGSARPTGGAGVVAMLIGPNAPLVFERGLRGTHMEHVYDFYKPDLSSEFPEVDGPLTIACFFRALDHCYGRYLGRLEKKECISGAGLASFDYLCLHSPYTKLVQKSLGRLAFNDFLRNGTGADMEHLQAFKNLTLEETYFNKEVEKAFVEEAKPVFGDKVDPTLMMAKNIGNMYCGSLYACLASLVSTVSSDDLVGKRIGMYSYGSGLAATMFSIRVVRSVAPIAEKMGLVQRLSDRIAISPADFEQAMKLREETHNLKGYTPVGEVNHFYPGTYYLDQVDDKFRRYYKRV